MRRVDVMEALREPPDVDIAELRERLDLTQAQLAELVGTAESSVWAWENGRRDVPATARRVLAVLDLSETHGIDHDDGWTVAYPLPSIPTALVERRKALGWAQYHVGEALGVTTGAISQRENGSFAASTLEGLDEWARLLGLTVSVEISERFRPDGIEATSRGWGPTSDWSRTIELHRKGWTLRQIGDELGITGQAVSYRLKSAGIDTRRTDALESVDPLDILTAADTSSSLKEVADKLDVSVHYAKRALRKIGAELPASNHSWRTLREWADAYRSGKSSVEIADKAGVSYATVLRGLRLLDVQIRSPSGRISD